MAIGRQIDVSDIEIGGGHSYSRDRGTICQNRGDSTALGIQSRPQSLEVRMYGVMVTVVSASVAFLKLTEM